jgi:hypothetical protein
VINRSTIGYWTKRMTVSETGKVDGHDLLFSVHPVTAVSPVTLQCADAIICENQHITT